jgi:hypothetical protein
MLKITIRLLFVAMFFSCKTSPDASRRNDRKVYKLSLRPAQGAKYYYDVTNETQLKMEVDGRKVDNLNRSHTGINYILSKDSAGNLTFDMTYDKIHLYSKNNDVETDLDAANAAGSVDPMEKMLGMVAATHIIATMNTQGKLESLSGYKEMTDKILASLNTSDPSVRKLAQDRLEQTVKTGLIKNNMDQLFRIFPDSAVHIGDKWKLSSEQSGAIKLNVKGTFTLEKIEDGLAYITSRGDMSSDSANTNLQGYDVTTNLKGTQEGEYEMDVHTGMLLSARISASVEGTLDMIGRQIPVTVEMKVNMKGQKIQ